MLETIVDPDAQAVEQVAQQEGAQQTQHCRGEQPGLLFEDHPVDHQPDQLRMDEGKGQSKDRAGDIGQGHPFVRAQINGHAPDNLPGGPRLRRKGWVGTRRWVGVVRHTKPEPRMISAKRLGMVVLMLFF